MSFELTNDQRLYFGLEPINPNWSRVLLKGDTYRPESLVYFHGNTIKRHIISTDVKYEEKQYDDQTRERAYLLPVTTKGKERKLTASVLESRQPQGVYCYLDKFDRILIGNHDTQTTFYDSSLSDHYLNISTSVSDCVSNFISKTPITYFEEIELFKNAKRKNVKFKEGDIFAFKINLEEYAFGRILLNIDELRKKGLTSSEHGLSLIMGKPVLIKLYAYTSKSKHVDVEQLLNQSSLPSDYIMDNRLFYGEYEIIDHRPLTAGEMDFPMSYGRNINPQRNSVFFQWGLIHLELPLSSFNKYLSRDNPYGYYSVGFYSKYGANDIKETIANRGIFDYANKEDFKTNFDLRNPQNEAIKHEVMRAFALDPAKGYEENCLLAKAIDARLYKQQ